MKAKNRDLHGLAPDHSAKVLLIVDMIADFKFGDGERLLRRVMPVARNIAALKARARKAGVPTIYINDNFGRWRSDAGSLVRYCSRKDRPGADVVKLLAPAKDDYFVIKPKHSGFFATALDTLLA